MCRIVWTIASLTGIQITTAFQQTKKFRVLEGGLGQEFDVASEFEPEEKWNISVVTKGFSDLP